MTGVHDLHVWQMSAERVALSAHLTLADGPAWPRVLASAQRMLAHDFGIDHVTLQPAWPAPPPSGRVIPVAPRGRRRPRSRSRARIERAAPRRARRYSQRVFLNRK